MSTLLLGIYSNLIVSTASCAVAAVLLKISASKKSDKRVLKLDNTDLGYIKYYWGFLAGLSLAGTQASDVVRSLSFTTLTFSVVMTLITIYDIYLSNERFSDNLKTSKILQGLVAAGIQNLPMEDYRRRYFEITKDGFLDQADECSLDLNCESMCGTDHKDCPNKSDCLLDATKHSIH